MSYEQNRLLATSGLYNLLCKLVDWRAQAVRTGKDVSQFDELIKELLVTEKAIDNFIHNYERIAEYEGRYSKATLEAEERLKGINKASKALMEQL